ncbi:hypothetical protein ES708_25670 [subsurface metagenome]
MASAVSQYLDSVRNSLQLDPLAEGEIIKELETHIEDRLDELKGSGLSEDEAADTCVRLLGSAKQLARQIYEAHSQGTWQQTLLASMPHFLFALMFALNWWQGIGWLLVVLPLIVGVAIYGWFHGKPAWLFPWLGYSVVPVIASGLLLLWIPKAWSWLAIFFYIPLALWLLCSIAVQTIKKDWLYSSLMLLPVPTIAAWILVVEPEGRFPGYSVQHIYELAPWIGLSFLALAVSVGIFIRLRQRWLKQAVLFLSGVLTLVIVVYYTDGRLSLTAFSFLVLIMLGLFLVPALLGRKIKCSR